MERRASYYTKELYKVEFVCLLVGLLNKLKNCSIKNFLIEISPGYSQLMDTGIEEENDWSYMLCLLINTIED